MAIVPYMVAVLIYYSKVRLVHGKAETVAIAEAKAWKVPVSKDYPEGIKYSLFLVAQDTGEILLGFDNHKPKGHHVHRHGREESHEFSDVDCLVEEFWDLVKKEGFQI